MPRKPVAVVHSIKPAADYIEIAGPLQFATSDDKAAFVEHLELPTGTGGAHTHPISQVSGLQAALDSKADASALASKADASATATALAGKAASAHGHAIGDITGLQAALDSAGGATAAEMTGATPYEAPGAAAKVGDILWNPNGGDVFLLLVADPGAETSWVLIGKKKCAPQLVSFTAYFDAGSGNQVLNEGEIIPVGALLSMLWTIKTGYPETTPSGQWFRLDGSNDGNGTPLGNNYTVTDYDAGYVLTWRGLLGETPFNRSASVPNVAHLLNGLTASFSLDEGTGENRMSDGGGSAALYNLGGTVYQNTGNPAPGSAACAEIQSAGVYLGPGTSVPMGGGSAGTIAFWCYISSSGGDGQTILGSETNRLTLKKQNDGNFTLKLESPGGGQVSLSISNGYNYDQWQLFILEFSEQDGTGSGNWNIAATVYNVSGAVIGGGSAFNSGVADPLNGAATGSLLLGYADYTANFIGRFDSFAFWSRILSPVEKAQLAAGVQYASWTM